MYFHNLFFKLTLFLIPVLFSVPREKQLDIVAEFNKIKTTPEISSYSNNFEINNTGGHLQGIQKQENSSGKYIFLSGSSDSYSYCTVVKFGDENRVVSVNKLMQKPFKHAGGFQVFQNYLAVGIEDNSLKDKSKVCIYNISEPEKPFNKPIAIIEINGEPLRSTAGCIGLTNYKNEILLAVGDWDTKHIDFYSFDFSKLSVNASQQIGTIETEKLIKSGWIDNEWHSYQNINLFNINNNLYLVGLGQNKKSEDIADLYELTEESVGNFTLKKVASKIFSCTNDCSFKAGAGVEFANGVFKIFACGYNISETSYLNVFSKNQ